MAKVTVRVEKTPPPTGKLRVEIDGEPVAPPAHFQLTKGEVVTLAWIAWGNPGGEFSIEVFPPNGHEVEVLNDRKNPVERTIAKNRFVHSGSIRFKVVAES